jgi:hypothetical protein
MTLWIKWAANAHKDAIISTLSDIEFRAFITILSEAKGMRKGGEFKDRKHLAAVIGARLARTIPRLIAEGLLTESGAGLVGISNWSRWQVDATSALRQQRSRAGKGAESRFGHAIEQSRVEQRREEQTLTKSRMIPLHEILGGGKG